MARERSYAPNREALSWRYGGDSSVRQCVSMKTAPAHAPPPLQGTPRGLDAAAGLHASRPAASQGYRLGRVHITVGAQAAEGAYGRGGRWERGRTDYSEGAWCEAVEQGGGAVLADDARRRAAQAVVAAMVGVVAVNERLHANLYRVEGVRKRGAGEARGNAADDVPRPPRQALHRRVALQRLLHDAGALYAPYDFSQAAAGRARPREMRVQPPAEAAGICGLGYRDGAAPHVRTMLAMLSL